jgi:hypothetical protein
MPCFRCAILTNPPVSRRRSLRNSSGAAALLFAGGLATLLIVAASAIEIGRISEAKAKLASAADAAALSAKKKQIEDMVIGIPPSKVSGEAAGQASFTGNVDDLEGWAENPVATITWDSDLSARVVATADAKLVFGAIFSLGGALPLDTIPLRVTAVAASGGNSFYEVAMVLDNTGSMFAKDGRPDTRFSLMRDAARSFVNAAYDNQGVPDRLRVAVVPWATTVNILGEQPLGWDNAPYSDGAVPDKGTQASVSSPMNRASYITDSAADLASKFAPVGWRGCVAGAGESQTPGDDLKGSMSWNALAVPPHLHQAQWRPLVTVSDMCEVCTGTPVSPTPSPPVVPPVVPPATPGGGMIGQNQTPRGQSPQGQTPRFAAIAPTRSLNFGPGVAKAQVSCTMQPCTKDECDWSQAGTTTPMCWQGSNKGYGPFPNAEGRRNAFFPANTMCSPLNHLQCTVGTEPQQATPGCVSDPNEWAWNNGGGQVCATTALSAWTSFEPTVGPNLNCPSPMLGLSGSRAQVLQSINRMTPVAGGTHADVGLRWGLRAISPRAGWADFFGIGAQAPRPFGDENVKKAMILITDGQNTQAEDFPGFWGCSDTDAPGCSGAPDQATLDDRMEAWCEEIREDREVELYTVAVNISDATAVAKLAACAGDPTRAFSVDAAELSTTLGDIARSIFQLRLKE